MAELSPAAQAVLSAVDEMYWDWGAMSASSASEIAAAALRAVAEHCVPDDSEGHWVYIPYVLKIADELEGT